MPQSSSTSRSGRRRSMSPVTQRWFILALIAIASYQLTRPWLQERLGTNLPSLTEVFDNSAPAIDAPGESPAPSTTSTARPTSETPAAPPPQHRTSNAGPAEHSPPQLLRELPGNVFVSPAGLEYRPGSADGHRLQHLLQHLDDDPDKPIHGVYEGNREQVLALVDEAYRLALAGGPRVTRENQDRRTVYTVDLQRRIGFVGGESGQKRQRPPCSRLRIVLEGNALITAFPVER